MPCKYQQLDGRQVTCHHPVASLPVIHGPHPHIGVCESCRYFSHKATEEAQPKATIKAALKAAKVISTHRKVPLEIQQERMAACESCDKVRFDKAKGVHWCSMCGCRVSKDAAIILNLAAYEEGDEPLCKHPERSQGKGWRR